jgi:hypothetical protein
MPVTVEWYDYGTRNWSEDDRKLITKRLSVLNHLSSVPYKPNSLRVLDGVCIVEGANSMGVVRKLPSGASPTHLPVSLYKLLEREHGSLRDFRRPSLDQRLRLGQQLASSIYSFGVVRWFHKNFNSRSIIFFRSMSLSSPILLNSPFVTGFSVSRPDSKKEKSFNSNADTLDIYLHPDIRVNPDKRPAFHRKYELYSLGIVLFEIGMWRPIEKIVRSDLERYAFKDSMVQACKKELSFYAGEKYTNIVLWCLSRADQDVEEDETSLDTIYWSVVMELTKYVCHME